MVTTGIKPRSLVTSALVSSMCGRDPGVEPSPCFSNFLARTTYVLESLPEAKNPGQDAFLGILSLTAIVILEIAAYLIIRM